VLYVSFAPACLASFECMLACMPAYLLDNPTIILPLMVMKSLKYVLTMFIKTVLFSYIRTDLLYRYCFFVLRYMIVLSTMPLLDTWPDPCMLSPDSCMLSSDICLISLITCYLIHYCLLSDYHISGILSCYPVLYIQWPVFLVLMYSCNFWTCHAPTIPVIW